MGDVEQSRADIHAPRVLRALLGVWLLSVAFLAWVEWWPEQLDQLDAALSHHLPLILHIGDQSTTLLHKISRRLLMLVVGILPVFILEIRQVGYANSSVGRLLERHSTSAKYDVGFFLILFCGLTKAKQLLGTFGLTYLVGLAGNALLGRIDDGHWQIDTGSVWMNDALFIVAFTFFDYWNHRIFHMRPFWYLHRMHHSAAEMVTFTLYRDHPGTTIFEPIFKAWPMAFFAVSPDFLAGFLTLAMGYELLIHSNQPWGWGWFGRWVLTPPLGHRLHHSADAVASQKLLGAAPIWDRLFGTWVPVDATVMATPLGVKGAAYNTGNILREIVVDFAAFGRSVLGKPQRRPQPRQA